MAKYKVLKSVAHNVAASFVSLMNYAHIDYVPGLLILYGVKTGERDFFIDFVSGGHSKVFDRFPFKHVVAIYSRMFWKNVESQGAATSMVVSARLDLHFAKPKRNPQDGLGKFGASYSCALEIIDDRGKVHRGQVKGWEYPETQEFPSGYVALKCRLVNWC